MKQQEETVKVIFVRHGESLYNQRSRQLREKLGIGATWEQYLANPEFMEFKYSEEMLDCGLSQKGREQCQTLAGKLNQVDLVLVSPLYRALTSCGIIFKDYSGPIIAEPILAESMRCSCDVSFNLEKGRQQNPNFNFANIEGKESSWYIQNQTPEKRKVYEEYLKEQGAHSYEERARTVNKYMKETHNFEDNFDLIRRSGLIKEKLRQYAKEYKASSIGVVTHYYTILTTIADEFDEKGKPVQKAFIGNASAHELVLPLHQ